MMQVARNLTDGDDGFLRGVQYFDSGPRPALHGLVLRPAARQWRDGGASAGPESEFESVMESDLSRQSPSVWRE
jgi:hypothetical protein